MRQRTIHFCQHAICVLGAAGMLAVALYTFFLLHWLVAAFVASFCIFVGGMAWNSATDSGKAMPERYVNGYDVHVCNEHRYDVFKETDMKARRDRYYAKVPVDSMFIHYKHEE